MSLWTENTSLRSRLYVSVQSCSSLSVSTSSTDIRTRFPEVLTLPSISDPTLSSWPIRRAEAFSPLNRIAEVLATTLSPRILDRTVISSSVIPSEKYSSAGSGLMLANGRITNLLVSCSVGGTVLASSHGITILYTSIDEFTFFNDLGPRLISGNSDLFWT